MKIKKITHNHILSWIYALIVAVPLVTILVRCCYITFNKNAFESYRGSIVSYDELRSNDLTTVDYNLTYNLDIRNLGSETYNTCSKIITFEGQELLQFLSNYVYDSEITAVLNAKSLCFGYGVGESFNAGITLFDNNNNKIRTIFANSYNSDVTTTFSIIITNVFTLNNYNQDVLPYGNFVKYIPVVNDTLDNAFEYSINELTKNGNTGNLNLVNWFGDLFLDMDNAKTQLYLGFINYYMNYVLMVSCVYLLFSVLMWFLTWARRLLSKGLGD